MRPRAKAKGFGEGAYMDFAGHGASAQIEERKPVGLNEGDLESIVRDGFLGFCISAGCSMLLLFFSVYEGFAERVGESCFMIGIAFVGALLLAGRLFSDCLNSEKGSFGIFVVYVASFAMSMFFWRAIGSFLQPCPREQLLLGRSFCTESFSPVWIGRPSQFCPAWFSCLLASP